MREKKWCRDKRRLALGFWKLKGKCVWGMWNIKWYKRFRPIIHYCPPESLFCLYLEELAQSFARCGFWFLNICQKEVLDIWFSGYSFGNGIMDTHVTLLNDMHLPITSASVRKLEISTLTNTFSLSFSIITWSHVQQVYFHFVQSPTPFFPFNCSMRHYIFLFGPTSGDCILCFPPLIYSGLWMESCLLKYISYCLFAYKLAYFC